MKGEAMGNPMKKIDDLFKSSFEKHELTPSRMAWEKLENRLDKSKKPAWINWGKWAAAAAIFLTILSLFLFQSKNQLEDSYLITSRDFNPNTPPYAEFQHLDNTEKGITEDKEKINSNPKIIREANPVNKKIKSEKMTNSFEDLDLGIGSKEESKAIDAITLDADTEPKNFPIVITLPTDLTEIAEPMPSPEKETTDYKVKIISRGYAFQPEKETLVDELENKIDRFFNKVDHGFSDLQDKKDNLFASITTRKSK